MNSGNVRKIIIFRNDRFGEFLLIIPALRALKETFPGASISAVVSSYVKDIAYCIPYIDEVIEWDNKKHSLREIIAFIKQTKTKKFDLGVVFNPSKESNIITYFSGIPHRAGYKRKWGFLLNHKLEDKKYLGQKHEIEYNLELVRLIGAVTANLELELNLNGIRNCLPKELDMAILVAVHPWTSDTIKQWPQENFVDLVKRLTDIEGIKVVVVGGKEESDKSLIFGKLGNSVYNMTGKTTLPQLAAVIKVCRLLVSGDSGPVHIASCVGTPSISIFLKGLPGKSSTRWGPLSKGSIVIEKRDFSEIKVEEVVARISKFLKK